MPTPLLPSPLDLGAPAKFDRWRTHQDVAVLFTADAPTRFVMPVIPTGGGKSLFYMMVAQLTGARTCVLTMTKALQAQLAADFAEMGATVVQGMNAYPCNALAPGGEFAGMFHVDPKAAAAEATDSESATSKIPPCHVGPCLAGIECSLKASGCDYYDAVTSARGSQIVVTNYAFWLHQGKRDPKRGGLGDFDLLILDEAHDAPHALSDFLTVELDPALVLSRLNAKLMDGEPDWEAWVAWAKHYAEIATTIYDERTAEVTTAREGGQKVPRALLDEVRTMRGLVETLSAITKVNQTWVIRWDAHGKVWKFTPLYPAAEAERCLFKHVPRVVLTSATVTEKTSGLLGIAKGDLTVREFPSTFPESRRPVYHVPTIRNDGRASEADLKQWLARIDQILTARPDRKGIIQAVSYERARFIISRSKHHGRLIGHSSFGTRDAIRRFKSLPQSSGAVLVSPAVTTGYDFPYTDCEFQIIAKVPFPDTRDPVLKARTEIDKDYGMYLAMQTLVQMVGRGMRAEDDQCETFIIDDHIRWFVGKYRHLAPKWFVHAVKTCSALPAAPARLPVRSQGR